MTWRDWSPPLVTLVAMVVVWELAVALFRVPEYILPTPRGIAASMVKEWRYLALHTWITVQEVLLGFAMAVAVGIPIAMAIVYSPVVERAIYPLLVGSQSVPKIAIAPLLIFWAGLGLFPRCWSPF